MTLSESEDFDHLTLRLFTAMRQLQLVVCLSLICLAAASFSAKELEGNASTELLKESALTVHQMETNPGGGVIAPFSTTCPPYFTKHHLGKFKMETVEATANELKLNVWK